MAAVAEVNQLNQIVIGNRVPNMPIISRANLPPHLDYTKLLAETTTEQISVSFGPEEPIISPTKNTQVEYATAVLAPEDQGLPKGLAVGYAQTQLISAQSADGKKLSSEDLEAIFAGQAPVNFKIVHPESSNSIKKDTQNLEPSKSETVIITRITDIKGEIYYLDPSGTPVSYLDIMGGKFGKNVTIESETSSNLELQGKPLQATEVTAVIINNYQIKFADGQTRTLPGPNGISYNETKGPISLANQPDGSIRAGYSIIDKEGVVRHCHAKLSINTATGAIEIKVTQLSTDPNIQQLKVTEGGFAYVSIRENNITHAYFKSLPEEGALVNLGYGTIELFRGLNPNAGTLDIKPNKQEGYTAAAVVFDLNTQKRHVAFQEINAYGITGPVTIVKSYKDANGGDINISQSYTVSLVDGDASNGSFLTVGTSEGIYRNRVIYRDESNKPIEIAYGDQAIGYWVDAHTKISVYQKTNPENYSIGLYMRTLKFDDDGKLLEVSTEAPVTDEGTRTRYEQAVITSSEEQTDLVYIKFPQFNPDEGEGGGIMRKAVIIQDTATPDQKKVPQKHLQFFPHVGKNAVPQL